jgi:hypothetical protein
MFDRTASHHASNRSTRRVLADPLFGTQPVAGIQAATAAAQQAASTAAQTGAQYGAGAAGIGGLLVPELQADVTNPQGYGATTENLMLGQGLGAAGGAESSVVGQAGLQAARSRNVGGTAGVLDEAARDKMRTSAGVGLDVATKNAQVQQQQRSSALKQLEGIYGTDVGAQLKAQSLVPEDIDAWAKANQTGWLQNTLATIDTLKPGYSSSGGFSMGGGNS